VSLSLHLHQTGEREERVSLYMRDAVALGDLSVVQRNGSTLVDKLRKDANQITLATSRIKLLPMRSERFGLLSFQCILCKKKKNKQMGQS